jgi:hypothetical protein
MNKGVLNNPIEILSLRVSAKEKFLILKSIIKGWVNRKIVKKYIPHWFWSRPCKWWEFPSRESKPSKKDLIEYCLHSIWDKL